MLHETKQFLSKSFHKSDLNEASFQLGLEFVKNRSHGLLGFISEILYRSSIQRFDMQTCSSSKAPTIKCDNNSGFQILKLSLFNERYLCTQVCTCPNSAYEGSALGSFNLHEIIYWEVAKK